MSEIKNNADEIFDKLLENIHGWAEKTAEQIKEDATKDALATKTGKTRKIKGRLHTASAPGESPAKLTGELISSFQIKTNRWQVSLGTNLKRAKYLENMERPIFTNVINENQLKASLEEAINA